MTDEEARTIIKIMCTADAGCHVCAEDLINQFVSAFPMFEQIAKEIYDAEFDLTSADSCES